MKMKYVKPKVVTFKLTHQALLLQGSQFESKETKGLLKTDDRDDEGDVLDL